METNPLHSREKRSTCRLRRGSLPLRSWSWCIFILCWIIPTVRSSCHGINIHISMYPEGDIFVRHGDPLEIFCTADGFSSDDIKFVVRGVEFESEKINETTRRLYIENPEKQTNVYYCVNKKTNKKCMKRVLVDSPPVDVSDFNCVSRNLDVLNCSWTYPNSFTSNNYSLTFTVKGTPLHPYCKVRTTRFGTMSCAWDAFSSPRYRVMEETMYFLMTTCNVFGCNNQTFTVDHFSIVKPDPPTDLKVIKVEPLSVILRWRIPTNVYDFLACGVKHIIEYQIPKIDNATYFRPVNTSFLPSRNRTYQFQLNLPYSYMQYEVRIYIETNKAVKREFRSDFSYTIFRTTSKRPNRPPDMIAGAFDQAIWNGKRTIYVYWKQIEKYEEAGASFTYKVLYIQGNNTFPIVFPDKSKSLSYAVIRDVSLEPLNVQIWSSNTNGSSPTSSQMYIPSKPEIHGLNLDSFTKLSYENGTYQLFWEGIENIDNYTLIWCHHNITNICSGRIDFAVLDARKTSHTIDLPKEYRYQFAISANKGASSTGMVWTKCDISKDGFVMYRFPARLHYDAPGKSSVRVSWSLGCALQNGIITGYTITYCPVDVASGYCDESVENNHINISNPKQMNVVIENLYPFTTYQFRLSLNTIYGQRDLEDATAVLTTVEDTPTSPINFKISDVKDNSLVISWDPPLRSNGIIGKYIICNYDNDYHVISRGDVSKRQVTLTGLRASTNYSLSVKACNIAIGECSKPSPDGGLLVRTKDTDN